jgi:hypothetical protein
VRKSKPTFWHGDKTPTMIFSLFVGPDFIDFWTNQTDWHILTFLLAFFSRFGMLGGTCGAFVILQSSY